MTTHNLIFTGTAIVVALIVLLIQFSALAAGKFYDLCRRIDDGAEDLIKALDGE